MKSRKPFTQTRLWSWGIAIAPAISLCFIVAQPLQGHASRVASSARSKQSAKASTRPISIPSSVLIEQARGLYRKGKMRDAIAEYSGVDAGSPLWPEAYEERAWAHARLGEYAIALNHVKALTEPPLLEQSTLEPFFLGAMIRMKTCQYDEMYRLIFGFKSEAKKRLAVLEAASVQMKSSELWARIDGKDKGIAAAINTASEADSRVKELYAGLPRHFDRDRAVIRSKTSSEFTARAVALARQEARDIENVARKLGLVETEAASRVLLAKPSRPLRSGDASGSNESDTDILRFPDDPDDIWIDEVGLSRHQFDGCEQVSEKARSVSRVAVEQSSRKSKRAGDL